MEYAPKATHINASTEGTVLKEDGDGSEIQVENVLPAGQSGVNASDIEASANPIFQANLIDDTMKVYPDNDNTLPYTQLRGDATYVYMDATLNTFCTFGKVHWTDTYLDKFDDKGQKLFGYCDIEFPDSKELKFPIYGLYVGKDATDTLRAITYDWAEIDAHSAP
jgi:hypothetical protein